MVPIDKSNLRTFAYHRATNPKLTYLNSRMLPTFGIAPVMCLYHHVSYKAISYLQDYIIFAYQKAVDKNSNLQHLLFLT